MTTRVVLADNHVLVRQGIKSLLERDGFLVTGEAGDGQELVRIAKELQPDVVVLDIGMPLMNGLVAVRELNRICPKAKSTIQQVCRGQVYLSPGISRAVVEAYLSKSDVRDDPLSAREHEVLQLIAEGKSNKDVAAILGVSVKTADSHRSRLMQKLDIHETASLVRYAVRRGLVQP